MDRFEIRSSTTHDFPGWPDSYDSMNSERDENRAATVEYRFRAALEWFSVIPYCQWRIASRNG